MDISNFSNISFGYPTTGPLSSIGAFGNFLFIFVVGFIMKKLAVRVLTSRRSIDNNSFFSVIKNHDYISSKSKLLLTINFVVSVVLATISLKIYGTIGSIMGFLISFIILNVTDVLLLSKQYNLNYRLFISCFAIKLTTENESMMNELFRIYFEIKDKISTMFDKNKNMLILKNVDKYCECSINSIDNVSKVLEFENELGENLREELDASFKQFAELRDYILSVDNIEISNSKYITDVYGPIISKTSNLSNEMSIFSKKAAHHYITIRSRKAWINTGLSRYNKFEYYKAIQAYDKAIEIDPQYADAWYNKGIALRSLGQTIEAKDAFAKANELGYKGDRSVYEYV